MTEKHTCNRDGDLDARTYCGTYSCKCAHYVESQPVPTTDAAPVRVTLTDEDDGSADLAAKWRRASASARASEHHFAADCLAEAAAYAESAAARESALRAQIKAEVLAGPSCGVASRGHEGCYVADAARIAGGGSR